jgi:hypothetical protein
MDRPSQQPTQPERDMSPKLKPEREYLASETWKCPQNPDNRAHYWKQPKFKADGSPSTSLDPFICEYCGEAREFKINNGHSNWRLKGGSGN